MSQYPTLSKAPIVEALIDIRVKRNEGIELAQLDLYDSVKSKYPIKKQRHKFESSLEFKDGKQPISNNLESSIDGYIFTSADQKNIFQARLDGFTFSKLQPYQTWSALKDESKKLWDLYSKQASPEITRVALRYINKIELPLTAGMPFSDYLKAAPIVPEDLPQGISGFLTRVVINEPKLGAQAVITQALEPAVNSTTISIVLDIDVYKYKPEGISEGEAWKVLEELRTFKNDIFFSSITDKLKELFK